MKVVRFVPLPEGLDRKVSGPMQPHGAIVGGGPGSGPRPGVRNPWYDRGSKPKVREGGDPLDVQTVKGPDGVVMEIAEPIPFLNAEIPRQKDWGAVRAAANQRRAEVAKAYEAITPPPTEEALRAYGALRDEVREQFGFLTDGLGVTVTFQDTDPYPTYAEMVKDLAQKRLKVLRTTSTGAHPFFTNDENDMFRAVHDAFGHGATGRGFDRHGEEAAYQAHSQMFSPLAGAAAATELRGQNSYLTTRGSFPEQKIGVLPEEFRAVLTATAAPVTEVVVTSDDDNLYPWAGRTTPLVAAGL